MVGGLPWTGAPISPTLKLATKNYEKSENVSKTG